MIKYVTVLVTLFSCVLGFSQILDLENEITKSCKILIASSTGSGCIYVDSTNIYLITARHNLFNSKIDLNNQIVFSLKNDSCKIISFARDISNNPPDTLSLNLLELDRANMLKLDVNNDVAVAKLGTLRKVNDSLNLVTYLNGIERSRAKSTRMNGFQNEQIIFFNQVALGNEIFVVGYPSSVGLIKKPQFDYNRPLLKKGIVSGKSLNFRTFIIDAHVYGGNSGGPVLQYINKTEYRDDGIYFEKRVALIGIVTQFIPFVEVWTNSNYNISNMEIDNSGYSVIVPIDYAIKLISTF